MPEDGKDEGLGFEAGAELGKEEALEELADRLIDDEGFDPDEVEELLYDPAPRRRRGRRRRSRRYYDPDPAPRRRRGRRRRSRRYYDPAPRRGYGRRAKGVLGKLKKVAMPGAAAITFYAAYKKRADDLGTTVWEAIQEDIKNFDAGDAVNRLQDNAGAIITPLAGGWLIKKSGLLGKYSGFAGDLISGLGVGKFAKTVLDPPITGNQRLQARSRPRGGGGVGVVVGTVENRGTSAAQPRRTMKNPYE